MSKIATEDKKKAGRIRRWFAETKSELKKVGWPTWRQTMKNTNIVFLMILLFGVLVWVFDFGLMEVLNSILDRTQDNFLRK